MTRPRACGALIQDGHILMVRHVEPTRAYWTLPGGGLEAGETPAEAAVREVWEETGLRVQAIRLLWEGIYGHGGRTSPEYCFLVEAEGDEPPRVTSRRGSCWGWTPRRRICPPRRACCRGQIGCRWRT